MQGLGKHSTGPPGALTATPALVLAQAGRPEHPLDCLLLFSHYIAIPHAAHLDREEHCRDYAAHVQMFAVGARTPANMYNE